MFGRALHTLSASFCTEKFFYGLDASSSPSATSRRSTEIAVSTFDPLTFALEDWFDSRLCELPDVLRERVEKEFFSMPWDTLSADQRRSVALQLDYQHDHTTAQDQKFWWDFFERMDDVKKQVAEWEAVATPTAADLAAKEARLAQLKQELACMEAQQRTARGDYLPERKPPRNKKGKRKAEPAPAVRYVAYPKAMQQLAQRLDASPDELAAWIFMGPEQGGIAAYVNANELDPPPRFFYGYMIGAADYIAPLMGCWFKADDVERFEPADRYIVGAALIERWSQRPGLHAQAFIQAKIAESRLLDVHPTFGGTRGTFSEHADWPPLESGLFPLAQVLQIEAEDFGVVIEADGLAKPDVAVPEAPAEDAAVGSPAWRKKNAKGAADALHNKPGGSRDKREQIRAIWASGKYTTRDVCAEQECAALNMSFTTARKALKNTPKPGRC